MAGEADLDMSLMQGTAAGQHQEAAQQNVGAGALAELAERAAEAQSHLDVP
jgi:hypothetical protein